MPSPVSSASGYSFSATGVLTPVTPPSDTTQKVAGGATPSNHTFGAWTDPGNLINSYSARITNASGSTSIASGSGLGPYVVTGFTDSSAYALALNALDVGGNVLGTAIRDVTGTVAGGGAMVSLLDWSDISEAFAAGEGDYTIDGLSCRLDYRGTSGPSSIDMTNGEIVVELDEGDIAYLRIDLGLDVSEIPYILVFGCTDVGADSGSNLILQNADDNTIIHNSNHFQMLLGQSSGTKLLERECTSSSPSFTTVNSITGLTDIKTTPTRMMMQVFGSHVQASYDQGTYALPALNGAPLSNIGPNAWRGPAGSGTPGDRRFLGINFNAGATVHLAVYKLAQA